MHVPMHASNNKYYINNSIDLRVPIIEWPKFKVSFIIVNGENGQLLI